MTPEKITQLAEAVARRFHHIYRWTDPEDLTQEAWRVALEASRTFDTSRGTAEGAYVWRALVRAIQRYVRRAAAPVSSQRHGNATKLAETRALALDCAADVPVEESDILRAQWCAAVRKRLEEIASGRRWSLEARTNPGTVDAVAARWGLSRSKVAHDATAFAKRVRRDTKICEAWEVRA